MRPDPIPLDTQARILDAAIRAPNGGNTQRWHFLLVDDPTLKRTFGELYRLGGDIQQEEFKSGRIGFPAPGRDRAAYAEALRAISKSADYLADHFDEVPLLLFVFAIDDHGGANIFPAIWSALLAARAEGVGGVLTTVLRYFAQMVNDLLGVPVEQGWKMSAVVAFGYPLGKWGVAVNRYPVHEVSSRNRWGAPFGAAIPEALWPRTDGKCLDERLQRPTTDASCHSTSQDGKFSEHR
ncbi:nitroreductase family protein [Mycobacterium intracellulare subsp. chimaera]|uniref:Nitroreductase family protein n=2 Tax=Mycobacterium intracellulare TaxID=1767 RepID=A0A220YH76_MYCIT|nr:nitroreductase family protein [Mycobacterium intracellulare]AOS93375.1 nitroreductase [Mycobacterium intracellulare subsp. chimaera]ARV83779.1 nitroreductase [Mycobacterium intracellulare subsp. chimaera]ASL11031.1 putative oxidoreductase [Mycobacterium intracellulare subsp. chimaera]ASL16926.1 putative oxidoreductase [Mycobacterium intracellulare subsp. chimaera]ASL22973.1 putative oxidoreductase [Mycobacterium intracellulare subsp. chimaera]